MKFVLSLKMPRLFFIKMKIKTKTETTFLVPKSLETKTQSLKSTSLATYEGKLVPELTHILSLWSSYSTATGN